MRPNDVLDMSMDVFTAYVDGYSDHLLDQQILAMQTGHWAAYFVGSKHPKSIKELSEKILNAHLKKDAKAKNPSTIRPDVDVNAFLEKEARFKARMASQGR